MDVNTLLKGTLTVVTEEEVSVSLLSGGTRTQQSVDCSFLLFAYLLHNIGTPLENDRK